MNGDFISLTNDALWLVLILSAPPIIVASVAGLLVAIVQAATQIQEQTLQYTAKFFAIVLTLFVTASLIGASLYRYSDRIFSEFPAMIRR
ncbi:type III secretion system export apparatus subunit SctS [Sphingomonas sp. DG1-23]|jgi:type III secretion protein S|uniref:Type III secretion system export apparatus subunit SctS n=2 Tax=Sphingomonas TaxID=13687 RepID=A0ABU3MZB5_9SPHN|nr:MULTISPECIES: type III secretion system export apparatus subunit SctS [Sphingomonas]MCX8476088.1 type III secretion system export apparatus subunit SctS [Sphingomonas sp.]MDP5279622.1 type III secretion system export apparatus subunit SctS [Sphingomonas sp. DG1-23]MDT8757371.1 type III secretion system export apparatus subunit SctS [Sphingomonas psychrotolerans]MDV3457224.1 type III secretion system export apparatus subunit SctS [Sphingomonas sp. HF-S4]